MMLNEFKPRKATFGFRVRVTVDNLMKTTLMLQFCLSIDKDVPFENNETVWLEIKTSGNYEHFDLTVYTNDEAIAKELRRL